MKFKNLIYHINLILKSGIINILGWGILVDIISKRTVLKKNKISSSQQVFKIYFLIIRYYAIKKVKAKSKRW